jgi:hypothetical protein
MIIRNDQMRSIRRSMDHGIEHRIARYLQLRYAALWADIEDEIIVAIIRKAIEKARSYGLTWESALVRYADLMCTFAPNFDQQESINARLTDPTLLPEARLDAVYDRTSYREWMEVCNAYDPFAWGVDVVEAPELLNRRGEVRGGNP